DVKAVYLGRPWRPYAKTVFISCEMGGHIRPEGWNNWSDPSREATTFYGEYGNTGQGANLSNRVKWMKKLTREEAQHYNLKQIFRGWEVE
ncbi:MAG: pectin esterase, partial [Prolixibacteraceae bacterium]|nr:pectin esterase [Prolixibacteraceae bacterium]